MPQERLQKIISAAGVASRRAAEELITTGRVSVNGEIVSELGAKADASVDQITVNGKPIEVSKQHMYLMMHKPKGYVTTVSDPEGRPTVMDLLPPDCPRVYPVGRLDYLTEGLLLFTNDGDLAYKLTQTSSHVSKTYLVKVSGNPTEEDVERLRRGIRIEKTNEEGRGPRVKTAPARIRWVRQADNPWLEVTLIEGRNRQIRKMFEEVGHHVEKIRRIAYGPIELDLETGVLRSLKLREVVALKQEAGILKRRPEDEPVERKSESGPSFKTRKFLETKDRPAKSGFARANFSRAGASSRPGRAERPGDRPQRRTPAERDRPARVSSFGAEGRQDRPYTEDSRPSVKGSGSSRPTGARSERPYSNDRKPDFRTNRTTSGGDTPRERPYSSDRKASFKSDRSGSGGDTRRERPYSNDRKPSFKSDRPVSGGDTRRERPYSNDRKPSFKSDRPVSAGDTRRERPYSNDRKPSFKSDRPVSGGDTRRERPYSNDRKPSFKSDRPVSAGDTRRPAPRTGDFRRGGSEDRRPAFRAREDRVPGGGRSEYPQGKRPFRRPEEGEQSERKPYARRPQAADGKREGARPGFKTGFKSTRGKEASQTGQSSPRGESGTREFRGDRKRPPARHDDSDRKRTFSAGGRGPFKGRSDRKTTDRPRPNRPR